VSLCLSPETEEGECTHEREPDRALHDRVGIPLGARSLPGSDLLIHMGAVERRRRANSVRAERPGVGRSSRGALPRRRYQDGLFRDLFIDVETAGHVIDDRRIRAVSLTGSVRAVARIWTSTSSTVMSRRWAPTVTEAVEARPFPDAPAHVLRPASRGQEPAALSPGFPQRRSIKLPLFGAR